MSAARPAARPPGSGHQPAVHQCTPQPSRVRLQRIFSHLM